MFGVDSDDGFEEEAPQRIDAAAGPATVERRLEKWDALARTLSDDEEDGATKDAKDAAAAYARLVEACGAGPNDWEVLHDRAVYKSALLRRPDLRCNRRVSRRTNPRPRRRARRTCS